MLLAMRTTTTINQSINAVVIVIGINSIEKQLGIPHWILMEK